MYYFGLKKFLAKFLLENIAFGRKGPALTPTWEDQVISYNTFVPVH